ncbi:hypothetical protein BIW11_08682 [Tropilaelaps mercedesae]|uniref:Uncharacterized protein n=1 Tax=Tropilaelaps mercedesae TaxID=418985 RepID=A0A1V9XNS8_9ACAR|nr:hypothetical protein BIW11_08682 [Tropilaelaps mercedesae]
MTLDLSRLNDCSVAAEGFVCAHTKYLYPISIRFSAIPTLRCCSGVILLERV